MSPGVDQTHDPNRTSWVPHADGHPDFPVQNLALCVFQPATGAPRCGVGIGGFILDLKAAAKAGLLPATSAEAVAGPLLNRVLGLHSHHRLELRRRLSDLLSRAEHRPALEPLLFLAAEASLHLPAAIGDYTDFYAGIHHATNVGHLLRPDNPLLPNYKYIPIGYHGRASSVRASGSPVVRPNGQRKAADAPQPSFGPSERLDHEVELAVWLGPGNALGTAIPIDHVAEHIAGIGLLNDWSARDLQAWEYQPLGPFLAKSFHTTVSPWIVTAEALAPFRIPQPPRPAGDPQPLPYLSDELDQRRGAFAIVLEAHLLTQAMRSKGVAPYRLSRAAAANMYWTVGQLVAHHSSNGCNLRPGDLLGTGTISSPDRDGYGSMLELTEGGRRPIELPNGEQRIFLEDGDEMILSGRAEADGFVGIGLGSCRAAVLPAKT